MHEVFHGSFVLPQVETAKSILLLVSQPDFRNQTRYLRQDWCIGFYHFLQVFRLGDVLQLIGDQLCLHTASVHDCSRDFVVACWSNERSLVWGAGLTSVSPGSLGRRRTTQGAASQDVRRPVAGG